MPRDVHMLRERAAVHRTIHANRISLAKPRDEGYLFEAAEDPPVVEEEEEDPEMAKVVVVDDEEGAPAGVVPGEVVLPEADAVIPARKVTKKKTVVKKGEKGVNPFAKKEEGAA